jgi:hypothetical protein
MKARTKARDAATGFDFPSEAYAMERVPGAFAGNEAPAAARLGRYATFQARDFATQQGAIMMLLALVLTVPILGSYFAVHHRPFLDLMRVAFASVAGLLVPAGALLSVRGIVSNDTQHGYHRFLFSKPLDIGRYYTQAFGVKFAGFMAVLALVLLPFALFVPSVAFLPMLGVAALFFTLVGGVSFLFSTLSRHDTFFAVLVGVFSGFVSAVSRDPFFAWLRPLHWLLPPVEQLFQLLNHVINGRAGAIDLGEVLWVAGYGIVSFVAGLAVLRRRALSA